MSACRLYVVLFLCFGLTVLFVNGGVPTDDIVFPESLSSRHQHSSWNFDNERPPPRRTIRQGNRRPRPPMPNEEDPFAGLEPQGNNRPSGGNQGQWSNQRPNQQPGNQNQWGTNGNNQGQNLQWGTNGNNQGQNQWGTNGNNQGQNQWGTNGNNQGQNQWGTNGNNQGQSNQGNRPPTQPNTNQGNRPPTQPTTNQNPVQTSTTSSNSEEASEEQRNACNATCKERITNEYNPVCGSDFQTYQNRRFLDCVANCGIITEFSYIGTCVRRTQRITRA
ncbi:uncharacterized protein LOC100161742 precursor [Acyrthosiphon pisum]|uniref:ACYPI002942 protein n=1 Tax=Acyrthosiphon pisum TaxID=7029 RepID=C4WYC3_ACYPI|nr:uncharacterized protein LOC100161742 precursor [Acyrthosiphon pisum]BAH72893.1 ACYPI002942 [Acyrthosiphon pisum]|eukprot:NP_001280437.1 uncharacterized protein LOC100161742 precursor [Acyrthosiphon pisum]